MRKTATVRIDADGKRDAGKTFVLTEMPAMQAEGWAIRALLALSKSDVTIPPDIARQGLAGIASLGLKAISRIPFVEAQPLLTEMMSCVQFMPDPSRPMVVRPLIDDDVEELATLGRLRMEVFQLHVGFSMPVGLLASAKEALMSTGAPNTSTSQKQSRRSSRRS
jgi:hypothetical protein